MMQKLPIKSKLYLIISCFLAYFLTLANSWPQNLDTSPAKAQTGTENNGNAALTQTNQQNLPASSDNFITNLITPHLTDNSLLSKSITNIDPGSNTATNQETTKIISNTSGIINNNQSKKNSSLMYDDDELSDIDSVIESLKNDQVYVPADKVGDSKRPVDDKGNIKSYIYLGSIIYFGPKNWTVWIDNRKINCDDNKNDNELYLTLVTNSDVSVLWTMSISKWKILSGKKNEKLAPKINGNNQVEIRFTLKTNQTYILTADKIADGFLVPPEADSGINNNKPGTSDTNSSKNIVPAK